MMPCISVAQIWVCPLPRNLQVVAMPPGKRGGRAALLSPGAFVDPPESFVQILDDLYCAGSIHPYNLPFLKRLGLNSVVTLSPETSVIRAVEDFYQQENIQHIYFGTEAPHGDFSEEMIVKTVNFLLDAANYPVLIHSSS